MKNKTKMFIGIAAIILIVLVVIVFVRGGISGNTISDSNAKVINIDANGSGYFPNYIILKKGVPVKLNINANGPMGCNNQFVSETYNLRANLSPGINTVEFTPDKDGTFSFHCSMNMIRGKFIVTDDGTVSSAQINSATTQSSGTCSMGSNGGSCSNSTCGMASGGGCGCGMRR